MKKTSESGLKYLVTVGGDAEALVIESLLRASGIACLREADELGGHIQAYMGSGGSKQNIKLYVSEQDFEDAKALLASPHNQS